MEIFFQVKFSKFQFDVQLRAQTLKSQSPSGAVSCALLRARLELPVPPFPGSSQSEHCGGDTLCLAVPVTIWAPIWLHVGAQSRAQGCVRTVQPCLEPCPRTGSSCWCSLIKGATEKVRGDGQAWREGDLLSGIRIFCGMEGKRIDFGVADSICAEGKEGVGRGGNGNRCSFNG